MLLYFCDMLELWFKYGKFINNLKKKKKLEIWQNWCICSQFFFFGYQMPKNCPKKTIVHNPYIYILKVPLWDFFGKTASHQPRAASSTSESTPNNNKGCVTLWPCHFTLKTILRQKKNYGISNISPCKNIIFIKKN